MNTPLSLEQKRIISQLARSAYEIKPDREAFELINSDLSATKCFEAWRHFEQGKACGVQSLRECTQAHYLRLKAHFESLGGRLVQARRTLNREAGSDARIALFKLREVLKTAGLDEAYAATICRSKYRTELGHASAKQLWDIFYTIRNRSKKKSAPPRAAKYVPPEVSGDGNPY